MRALVLLLLLASCSALKVEGDCLYTRKVETTYHCAPGSSIEHRRAAPGASPDAP